MIEFRLNGQRYIRTDNGWTDLFYQPVATEFGEQLEKQYADSLDLSNCSVAELATRADGFKSAGAYYLAARYYRTAVLRADLAQCRVLFPGMAYCFRKLHQPDDVLRVLNYIRKRFNMQTISPVFLTPVAEAYCDLGQYEMAERCARLAADGSCGSPSPELTELLERIVRERHS
ncbi:MAG: hypothetical protein MJ065_03210 [Oscillospiraceae bacterium]|nr:hypothetical protein [Oscillospiraceae bacterium]